MTLCSAPGQLGRDIYTDGYTGFHVFPRGVSCFPSQDKHTRFHMPHLMLNQSGQQPVSGVVFLYSGDIITINHVYVPRHQTLWVTSVRMRREWPLTPYFTSVRMRRVAHHRRSRRASPENHPTAQA